MESSPLIVNSGTRTLTPTINNRCDRPVPPIERSTPGWILASLPVRAAEIRARRTHLRHHRRWRFLTPSPPDEPIRQRTADGRVSPLRRSLVVYEGCVVHHGSPSSTTMSGHVPPFTSCRTRPPSRVEPVYSRVEPVHTLVEPVHAPTSSPGWAILEGGRRRRPRSSQSVPSLRSRTPLCRAAPDGLQRMPPPVSSGSRFERDRSRDNSRTCVTDGVRVGLP